MSKVDLRADEQLNRNQWWGKYSIRHHVSKEAQVSMSNKELLKNSKFSFQEQQKKEE